MKFFFKLFNKKNINKPSIKNKNNIIKYTSMDEASRNLVLYIIYNIMCEAALILKIKLIKHNILEKLYMLLVVIFVLLDLFL